MKPETVALFAKRQEEGFDVEGDQLYEIWSKLKSLSIADDSSSSSKPSRINSVKIPDKPRVLPEKELRVSPALDEVLTYPQATKDKPNKKKGTSTMPKHLSSDEVIRFLENKKMEKEKEEEDKEQQKKEKERKKLEREEEKMKKALEREQKKAERLQRAAQKGQGRGRGVARR